MAAARAAPSGERTLPPPAQLPPQAGGIGQVLHCLKVLYMTTGPESSICVGADRPAISAFGAGCVCVWVCICDHMCVDVCRCV